MDANLSKFSYVFHSLHPWMNSCGLTPRGTNFLYYVPTMRTEVCKAKRVKEAETCGKWMTILEHQIFEEKVLHPNLLFIICKLSQSSPTKLFY
jgi:hypothetical protein